MKYGYLVTTALLALCLFGNAFAQSPDQAEFFENKIRPVLVENCYQCHAEDSEKLKGGLLLDSKAGWVRGGDSGEVILPGDADNSMLVRMVNHDPDYSTMPPKSKLTSGQIADLEKWINDGAFDPRDQPIGEVKDVDDFDLEERKQWWSFQPIKDCEVPAVSDPQWPANEYDNFILAELDKKSWKPAPKSTKRKLLRRLSFDLIGLAPTPQEIDAFLEDDSPDAWEKQVDRLLASPHFGEKWARHWMDAVRYGESKSFEGDYFMPHAHQYRNYLIRAFNDDVPYDQFVRESFAGDLMEKPRLDKTGTINESIKGPGFLYLTDGQHGPPDLHEDEARIFSGMIDTTSKTFLGVTVACARCHDHKFDAVTTGDYYAWYGMLRSSRLDISNTIAEAKQLAPLPDFKKAKSDFYDAIVVDATQDLENFDEYITAAKAIVESTGRKNIRRLEQTRRGTVKSERVTEEVSEVVKEEAAAKNLDPIVLKSWLRFVSEVKPKSRPELNPVLQTVLGEKPGRQSSHGKISPNYPTDLKQWMRTGAAFDDDLQVEGLDFVPSVTNDESLVQALVAPSTLTAGAFSGRISGSLRSPDFVLDGTRVEIYAKGRNARVSLIVRNYEQVGKGPTTRVLLSVVNQGSWQRVSFPTTLWKGLSAYIEVLQDGEDRGIAKKMTPSPSGQSWAIDADDSFVMISTENQLPDTAELWKDRDVQEVVLDILQQFKQRKLTPAAAEVLSSLFEAGLVRAGSDRSEELKSLVQQYRALNAKIPQPIYARSLTEGTPQDEPIYIRGSHKNLSKDPNPRRFMDALGGTPLPKSNSGRREFAERLVDKSNPLVSRVMVNRIWHHVFGRGIVASINDMGKLGAEPSHPELLDFLAKDFMADGWSVKRLIRKMVLSSTYQMSTVPNDEAFELDPNNLLLQRMPVKRLAAEQIRDHLLFVSGRLNPTFGGVGVESYTGDLPRARGYPGSGPLDGDGRRSVYLQLRRNFMPSFLRILGMPNGIESIGARNVTNVPAQSLALMNSELSQQMASAWAQQLLNESADPVERIHQIHLVAFGRPAEEAEIEWAKSLLAEVTEIYGEAGKVKEQSVWRELCHVMMNRKEFIYLF